MVSECQKNSWRMMKMEKMMSKTVEVAREFEEAVTMTEVDMVREPSHYKQGTFEVIDEMLIVFGPQKTFDFCIMNSWKYRARAPYKEKMEQDMEKSHRYLEMAKRIADKNKFDMPQIHLIKGE